MEEHAPMVMHHDERASRRRRMEEIITINLHKQSDFVFMSIENKTKNISLRRFYEKELHLM